MVWHVSRGLVMWCVLQDPDHEGGLPVPQIPSIGKQVLCVPQNSIHGVTSLPGALPWDALSSIFPSLV